MDAVSTLDRARNITAPRPIRDALIAAFATAILAGPSTWFLFLAALALQDGAILPIWDGSTLLPGLGEIMMFSTVAGLLGSVPAATINSILLAWLARRGKDSLWPAIASGCCLGLAAGAAIVSLVIMPDEPDGLLPGADRMLRAVLSFGPPFFAAGGFMGAIHWRIAIRPRRRWRLFQERERAALLAME
jgi:hypothetical protein